MDKRVYTKKLRLLKNEVDKMMLQEAVSFGDVFKRALGVIGKGNSATPKAKIEILKEVAKESNFAVLNSNSDNVFTYVADTAGKVKTDELDKAVGDIISKKVAVKVAKEEWKKGAFVGTTAGTFLTVAVTGTAVVAGSVILNKWRTSSGLKKVKSLYNKANTSDSYKDVSKYINALTKIRDDNGLWNRLTRSNSVKTAAGSAIEKLKKSYISVGVTMILLSAILCTISAASMNVVQPMVEAAKNLDWKQLLISVGKILAIGVMAIPAFIGVCLIVLALRNFPEKGFIADFIEYTAPAVNIARQALDEVVNTFKAQIG